MYLAMNRFKVRQGREAAFEAVWRERDSKLADVPGFAGFHMLRGVTAEGITLYASHTAWESEAHFTAWTRSEAFREAHKGAGSHRDLYAGTPELELFSSVMETHP